MALGLTSFKPAVMGVTHAVSAGHYHAATAGYRILEEGGNAIDAGVASGIAINVVFPQWTSFGGVAPIILYHAERDETVTISGLGRWPSAASVDFFKQEHGNDLPEGILRTVVPSAADAWLTALELYGTMSFEQTVTPALQLAESGFPVPRLLSQYIAEGLSWESSLEIFMPGGDAPSVGDVLIQKDLANTFHRMIEVERASASNGREAGIRAVRDFFYKGDLAREMVRFCQDQGGLLTMDDMASFHVGLEPAQWGSYKHIDIATCGAWCQGPLLIQFLNMLEGFDLKAMGYLSADYIHTLLETFKLGFADRHAYYGDPDFVDVPLNGLLSKAYAEARRAEVNMHLACPEMPLAGDPWIYEAGSGNVPINGRPAAVPGGLGEDTSYTCVVDRWGNAFSATPSDGFGGTPVVSGLGFILSSRGNQSWLDPDHPSVLAPGKRPRLTPNPALAFKDGRPWMPFGTPGGDIQCQAMAEMFINIVEFGMDPQQAIEEPRFATSSYPGSFWPHAYNPGLVTLEGRIDPSVIAELERRGHIVEVWDEWAVKAGNLSAIQIDRVRGILRAGADSRREGYAIAR
ncbi:gamma-glutamyltransferase family protein [SAR202 cluster bacterium AD-804-J14_MRT_500m]|nr:gamma-glutamyltransferase family protein [SAR202 cluster bacterium AD-804-J14_MRT_500m]